MRAFAIAAVLDDADQNRIADDFATFAGERHAAFLTALDRIRRRHGSRRWLLPASWCWPGFLFSAAWLFYRKCFIAAAIVVALGSVLPILLGSYAVVLTGLIPVGIGLWGKSYYAWMALGRIAAADSLGLTGAARTVYLERRGGTSWLVASAASGTLALRMLSLAHVRLATGYPHVLATRVHQPPPGSHVLALVAAAIVPGAILLTYGTFRAHSHWRRESLWAALALGVAVTSTAGFGELLMLALSRGGDGWPLWDAARIAVSAGVLEEGLKFLMLLAVIGPYLDFRRPHDWPLLGLAVGLGFAMPENLYYVLHREHAWTVATGRAFTAIPLHAGLGMIMGGLISLSGQTIGQRPGVLAAALLVPVSLHAAYDFFLLAPVLDPTLNWARAAFAVLLACVSVLAFWLFGRQLSQTRSQLAEAGLERRATSWLGWVLILLGSVPLLSVLIAMGVPEASRAFSRAQLTGLMANGVFPLLAGADLILDDRRRRRRRGRSELRAAADAASY